MTWRVKLLHLGSSRFFFFLGYKGQEVAGELQKDFEKQKKNTRQKLEWLLPISSPGSRTRLEVVTGRDAARAT